MKLSVEKAFYLSAKKVVAPVLITRYNTGDKQVRIAFWKPPRESYWKLFFPIFSKEEGKIALQLYDGVRTSDSGKVMLRVSSELNQKLNIDFKTQESAKRVILPQTRAHIDLLMQGFGIWSVGDPQKEGSREEITCASYLHNLANALGRDFNSVLPILFLPSKPRPAFAHLTTEDRLHVLPLHLSEVTFLKGNLAIN